MPSATSFSKRKKGIPHFNAYKGKKLIGICYVSTDIVPGIIGYNGPLKLLIGLYKNRKISGIKVLEHTENNRPATYIENKSFDKRFINKKISDRFKVGVDVESITEATITVERICSIVKSSSIMMYIYYFKEGVTKEVKKALLDRINEHLKTTAKIDRIKELAEQKQDPKLGIKADTLRKLEMRKYLKEIQKIVGKDEIEIDEQMEEKSILKPKWKVKKVNKAMIRKHIEKGNLSDKEAMFYKEVEE